MAEQEGSFYYQRHASEIAEGGIYIVADSSLEDLRNREEEVHRAFEGLLKKHIKASHGQLSVLPYSPEEFPAQRLDVVEIQSTARPQLSVLEGYAEAAYEGFPELKKRMLEEKNMPIFAFMSLDLEEGRDYTIALNHDRIDNTPLGGIGVLGGIEAAAQMQGKVHPDFYVRITVSKILSRVSALGLPATDILSQLDVLDMSIPPSKTVEKAGIDEETKKRFNRSLKAARTILKELGLLRDVNVHEDESGLIVIEDGSQETKKAIIDITSLSGTTDVYKSRTFGRNRHPSTIHMGPMSVGTKVMLMDTRIVPVVASVRKRTPEAAVGSIMNPPQKLDDAQSIMMELARLAEEATGINHIYHPTADSFEAAIQ